MKYLYMCEKCGKQFEDFNAAHSCEESHLRINNCYPEYDTEMAKFAAWKNGDVMPYKAVFATPVVHKEGDDEESLGCYFGLYEFKRFLRPDEIKKIADEHEARKEQERQWQEEWERKKKEEKDKAEATE